MKASQKKKGLWCIAVAVSVIAYLFLIHNGVPTAELPQTSSDISSNVLPDVQLVKKMFEELGKTLTIGL